MSALGLRSEGQGTNGEHELSLPTGAPGPAGEQHPAQRPQRVLVAGVVSILLIGTGLRVFVMNAYMPYLHNLDEIRNVQEAEEMRDAQTLQPINYAYPSFLFDLEYAALTAAATVTSDDGEVLEVQTTGTAEVERPGVMVFLRFLTGLLPGLLVGVLAAALAWILSRHIWTTLLAAATVALNPIDILFGNYVTPDAWAGAASMAAVFAATLVALRPTTARYVVTGLLVGLAAGTKYNCVLAGVPLLVAHVVGNRRPFDEWRKLVLAGFATFGLFALTTPSVLISPIELAVGFASIYRNYSIRGQLDGLGNGTDAQLGWLWYGFGLALLALPLCLFGRRSRRTVMLVPLSFCLVYPLALAAPKTGYARNLLPVTGLVACTAALGVRWVYATLRPHLPKAAPFGFTVAAALTTMVLFVPATHSAAVMEAATEDPWVETQEWLRENLEPGTVIATESWAPVVDEDRFDVRPTDDLGNFPLAYYLLTGVEFLITASNRNEIHLENPDPEPQKVELYRQILRPECRSFEAEGGIDVVGGGRDLEQITIVVVSVIDCVELDESSD